MIEVVKRVRYKRQGFQEKDEEEQENDPCSAAFDSGADCWNGHVIYKGC